GRGDGGERVDERSGAGDLAEDRFHQDPLVLDPLEVTECECAGARVAERLGAVECLAVSGSSFQCSPAKDPHAPRVGQQPRAPPKYVTLSCAAPPPVQDA